MNSQLRFFNWLKKVFSKKHAVKAAVEIPKAESALVVEVSRQPGLTCPECSTRIPVSINALLQEAAVICPACQLVLEVDAH